MARPYSFLLPGLIAVALFSGCGGTSNDGFFSPLVGNAGASGSSNTGGVSSTAGAHASSGGPGSAGSGASAGSAASAGSGGSGASAGNVGSGGSPMSGGTSAGGTSGSPSAGGSAADAGSGPDASCSELVKQATQQLEAARACNVAANAMQCTGKVTNRCNCQVPVQKSDSPEAQAYLKTLQQLEAKNCPNSCTPTLCVPMPTGNAQCKSVTLSSTSGTCVASYGPLP